VLLLTRHINIIFDYGARKLTNLAILSTIFLLFFLALQFHWTFICCFCQLILRFYRHLVMGGANDLGSATSLDLQPALSSGTTGPIGAMLLK